MEITINDLLQGKSTLIKNKQYLETKAYIEPFIDRMSKFTNDFRVQAKIPDQITNFGNNQDLTFNRVLIQAVLPPSYYEEMNHQKVVGMVYGLDVKNPIAKIYAGGLNMACTNLTVFSPEYLSVQDIEPESALNYSGIKNIMEMTDNLSIMLKKMKSTHIDRQNMTEYLGQWVDFALKEDYKANYGKIKIATSTPIQVYKDLFIDNDSDYFTPVGIDPDMFTVYNAFTDVFTGDSKDLMNKYEKTLLVSRMLNLA